MNQNDDRELQTAIIHLIGDNIMAIKYDKLVQKLKDAGITSYIVKRDKIVGQATYKKIREGGELSTKVIDRMCKLFNCQPGDILEYVPDEETQESNDSE